MISAESINVIMNVHITLTICYYHFKSNRKRKYLNIVSSYTQYL